MGALFRIFYQDYYRIHVTVWSIGLDLPIQTERARDAPSMNGLLGKNIWYTATAL